MCPDRSLFWSWLDYSPDGLTEKENLASSGLSFLPFSGCEGIVYCLGLLQWTDDLRKIKCLALPVTYKCPMKWNIILIDIIKCWQGCIEKGTFGAPGWLSRLKAWLRLRSWSHGRWVRALHRSLCWQLGAWSLLRILCLPLSLPLPCSHSISLCLKNKH